MTKKNDGYHLVTVRMPMQMVHWLDAETLRRKPGRDELNTPMSRDLPGRPDLVFGPGAKSSSSTAAFGTDTTAARAGPRPAA